MIRSKILSFSSRVFKNICTFEKVGEVLRSYGENPVPNSAKPGIKIDPMNSLPKTMERVNQEYKRIKSIFEGCDEKQLELIDGAILEAARLKSELDELNSIINLSGKIQYNPNNPVQQKELPVAKEIVKTRANYLNYISKLSNILGKSLNDEEDDELSDYE